MVQFEDGHLAISVSGDRGAKFVFGDGTYKHDPADDLGQDAIVATKSGNNYYMTHDLQGGTYVVNIRATEQLSKLVAAYSPGFPAPLPPLEFGKPWQVAEMHTSDVTGLLLSYKVDEPETTHGRRLGVANPFKTYRELVRRHRIASRASRPGR